MGRRGSHVHAPVRACCVLAAASAAMAVVVRSAVGAPATPTWLPPPSASPGCQLAAARSLLGRREAAGAIAGSLMLAQRAVAISGGGKDFSGMTLTQSFQGGDYKAKDFSGCVARNVDFSQAKLIGDRFYKADLTGSDFSGADLTGSSLEQANLEGVSFENAKLEGCYFSETITDAKSLKGASFTDALLPPKVIAVLCGREDVQASAVTRDSIPCP